MDAGVLSPSHTRVDGFSAAAQCSFKRGRTQARFRKKFLSDGLLQHKNLCTNVFCSIVVVISYLLGAAMA